MNPEDFLKTADHLVTGIHGGRPPQVHLRRAISTAYYAVFHCLARDAANLLVGSPGARRSRPAWIQVYRALEHSFAKKACKNRNIITRFPDNIQDIAEIFIELQSKRHKADYDPQAKFYKSDVKNDVHMARDVISRFKTVSVADRRAFSAYILFSRRSDA